MPAPLTDAQRAALPQSLPLWTTLPDRDALRRNYKFADFSAAWGL